MAASASSPSELTIRVSTNPIRLCSAFVAATGRVRIKITLTSSRGEVQLVRLRSRSRTGSAGIVWVRAKINIIPFTTGEMFGRAPIAGENRRNTIGLMVMSRVTVYGTKRCNDCFRSRTLLEEHGIEYEYHDIDEEPQLVETVFRLNEQAGVERRTTIPVIVIGETILSEPSDSQLASALGIAIR